MKLDSYKVNRKHRDQVAKEDCTQWVVSEWEEIKLFAMAKTYDWACPKGALWAIEKKDGVIVELGRTDKDAAYLAKYVTNINNEWHGYPVTPLRQADRPPTKILDAWRNADLITKSQQGRIVKGKF